ncbi:Acetolactate synthase isozyme 2 large subunit [Labrenzia sp. THAF82]|uniref:thiamine pyrophosphate-binding protein n=1 Tax=Labrenzia sp. THAF82 TaxID=2587861 RepID=UPI0012695B84|nr:thiamine pyrophosphate-binding protein [Labrenzia sp. THAF82]QFT30651.1 Acetolactate synthase isozyme 2 large subunit [Labrenzia sp. THAF82]
MQRTGADIIADAIDSQEDVDHVFFVDAVLRHTLIELEKRGVKRILAHSEKAAAYMADGYARASGKTGFCMAQAVGAANLAAGLQDAYLDRVPVVAITGRKPDTHQHRNAYQEVSHAPLYQPVTKFTAEVRTVDQLPRVLGHALRATKTGTRRPVHLDLDGLKGDRVEEAAYDGRPADIAFSSSGATLNSTAHPEDIANAASFLESASRPILVCGVTSLYENAGDAIKVLAEKHAIPIATSVGGRSVIETSHPNHIGVVGTYSAPYANRLLNEADLVIYVGCHGGDQISSDWTIPAPTTQVIQIDADPVELGRGHPNTCGLAGDLTLNCLALAKNSKITHDRKAWLDACSDEARNWLQKAISKSKEPRDLIPAELLAHEVGKALPENGILVADTGFSATWTAQLTEFRHPGQKYLRAAGSLGWAFPAAIGAQCGAMDQPVLCFSGDGAFYYHMGELETLKRWNLPLVTVINNNSALGQGLRSVKKLYENLDGRMGDLVEFHPTNFAELAKVFGIDGYRVDRADEIGGIIKTALANKRPAIIDVVTDPDCNPEPAWKI